MTVDVVSLPIPQFRSSEPTWLRRLPSMLWLILALALSVKAWVEPDRHTTYPCFETGTRCWWADVDLYDTAVTHQEYRYTPTFAVLFSPFALLPRTWGGMLWNCANVGVLYWSLRQCVGLFPGRWTAATIALFHGLVLVAAVRGMWAAQTNVLVFALMAAGAAAIAREKWWLAAVLIVGPSFIKVWPLAAALLFAAGWPRQLLVRMLIAGLGLAAIPFLTRPWGIVAEHYVNFAQGLIGPMQERHVYRDAWTIWELIHPPVWPAGYKALQLGTAAATLGLCLMHRTGRLQGPAVSSAATPTFILGTWCVWQLLFGPGVERNTLCLIAPMAAWSVVWSWETGLSRRGTAMAILGYGLIVAASFGILERTLEKSIPFVLATMPLGVACFGGWLLRWGTRAPTEGENADESNGQRLAA